jgi:hypothetical protein
MQNGDGFPDNVDEDGDVTVPYEIQHADTLGQGIVDFGEHSPCDHEPLRMEEIRSGVESAIETQDTEPERFSDPAYRGEMYCLYHEAKKCDGCVPLSLLLQFEAILEYHGII